MPGQPLSGVRSVFAIGLGNTWGTPVVLGANSGIKYRKGRASRNFSVEPDKSRGLYYSTNATPGPISCAPPYTFDLRYNSVNQVTQSRPQALFMGSTAVSNGNGTAKKLTHNFSKDTFGLFATIVTGYLNASGYAYLVETPSAQIVGVSISGQVGAEPLALTIETIGIDANTDSVVNTTTTFANVTIAEAGNPVMFSHLKFRMRDLDSTVLSDNDIIYPNKFSITAKRPMKGDYTGQYRTSGANPQDLIDQVSNDGAPDLKVMLEFATHTGTTYLDQLGSDTRKKLDITATGGAIPGSTDKLGHLWQHCHLQMLNDNPTDDDGRIKEPLNFIMHGLDVASDGMPGITDPWVWTETGICATSPLA